MLQTDLFTLPSFCVETSDCDCIADKAFSYIIKITEGMWEDLVQYPWCPLKKSSGYRGHIDREGLCMDPESATISKPRWDISKETRPDDTWPLNCLAPEKKYVYMVSHT